MSLDLSQNKLYGSFPGNMLAMGKALVELSLYDNFFTGSVPKAIEQCMRLRGLKCITMGFRRIPIWVVVIAQARLIRAESNHLSGEILELVTVPSSLEQVQIDK